MKIPFKWDYSHGDNINSKKFSFDVAHMHKTAVHLLNLVDYMPGLEKLRRIFSNFSTKFSTPLCHALCVLYIWLRGNSGP